MQALCHRLGVVYIFKASFQKANRSSGRSPAGPGLEQGLESCAWCGRVRPAGDHRHSRKRPRPPPRRAADVLQIPAFLCRQTELIRAAAVTGRPRSISRKASFSIPRLMAAAVEKARASGEPGAGPTERGSLFRL